MSETESKVYYASARERSTNHRGRAYRVIPRHMMRGVRIAYRERRRPRGMTDPNQVRLGMTALLHDRSIETVLPNGERIPKRAAS